MTFFVLTFLVVLFIGVMAYGGHAGDGAAFWTGFTAVCVLAVAMLVLTVNNYRA